MKELKQIAIVGTGPGHPDYLTQRAKDYLQHADIVLYDCLVDEIILHAIPDNIVMERVEKKYRKDNGIDIFDQEILRRMETCLKEGKRVVRIKPGDGMNFNSGGMEADYLIDKGYDIELVPGIPAHFAASNLFKLNLTEIGQNNGLMSCMADELAQDAHLFPHVAYLMKHGPIPVAFYGMRVETFGIIKKLLQENGICDAMPVAICGEVSLENQSIIKTNLGECVDLVELLYGQDKLPKHMMVLMGKYLFKSYVDFKRETSKKSASCQC